MSEARFEVAVDGETAASWSDKLRAFDDASLYQTWAYGAVRWGERSLSHLVVRRGRETVGMAQLVLVRLRPLGAGIAYLRWGPIWQRKGHPIDLESLQRIARALREEYVVKRRLFLRLLPKAYLGTGQASALQAAFAHCDSEPFKRGESYRTLDVDLEPPLPEIRRRLHQKWRNQLNRAEKNGLAVREGASEQDFAAYIDLHDQLLKRKRFSSSSDIREYVRMQRALAPGEKMRLLLCEAAGVPIAGLVGSMHGNTGIYLFGATSEEGMQTKAAYLLQWSMIERLKAEGLTHYDLGGINPDTNPGVYHFKAGMSGNDVLYHPPFVDCASVVSRIAVETGTLARGVVRSVMARIAGRMR
ncbi:MAG: GNAT family N-acetyltransferase [Burkholderiales bacterium]